jgi:hypothetical protein
MGVVPEMFQGRAADITGDRINGRATRRNGRGAVEIDVTSVAGKRHLPTKWRLWIPVGRIDLHARLTVAAHGGLAAH